MSISDWFYSLPSTWWGGPLVVAGLVVLGLLFGYFMEWLMPGSTKLKMKRGASYIPMDKGTIIIIALMGIIPVGGVIAAGYLLPIELLPFIMGGLMLVYIFCATWCSWMRRGRVPFYYCKQTRRSNIRPRRNTPASRRK